MLKRKAACMYIRPKIRSCGKGIENNCSVWSQIKCEDLGSLDHLLGMMIALGNFNSKEDQ